MFKVLKRFSGILGVVGKSAHNLNSFNRPSYFARCVFPPPSRCFSSNVDRQFSEVLSEEIKQERECAYKCSPPNGFSVSKRGGTSISLQKDFPDGVSLEVEMDLAGSVVPEELDHDESKEKDQEAPATLEARPDFKIKLRKPSGRSVLFHCSFPSSMEEASPGEQESSLPTFSVDMVEMEKNPGYFVYTDLFDDNMYDHIIRLLTDRGIDYEFQQQLQDYATSEEHEMYRSFLEEFNDYCKE